MNLGAVRTATILERSSPVGAGIERVTQGLAFGKQQPFDAEVKLEDLQLEKKLKRDLSKHFSILGYELRNTHVYDPTGVGERRYTAAIRNNNEIALLQIPSGIVNTDLKQNLSAFNTMLLTFKGMTCRCLSEGVQSLHYAYKTVFSLNMAAGDGKFISWHDIDEFRKRLLRIPLTELLQIESTQKGSGLMKAQRRTLGAVENDLIIAKLAKIAASRPRTPVEEYFASIIVRGSDWPEPWKQQLAGGWTGDASTDARELVNWMSPDRTYPSNHPMKGQSVLGRLLWRLLDSAEWGSPDDREVAKIIRDFHLIEEEDILDKLRTDYLRQG